MDDVLADVLDTCLERLNQGASVEECLIAFPHYQSELEGPLRAAARVQAVPRVVLSPTAAATIEMQMLARVAQLRATTASPTAVASSSVPPMRSGFDLLVGMMANVLRALGYRGTLSPRWLRAATAVVALVLALVLGTMTYAAARAIHNAIAPPSPTPTASTVAQTFTLNGPIEQLRSDRWVVNGITVALDNQAIVTGTPNVGAQAQVIGAFQADGTLLARTITVASAPTSVASAPTAVPSVESAPAVVATALLPTVTPFSPTPEPTAPPVPEPTIPPAQESASLDSSVGSFDALRALLVAGVADGRTGEDGKELIKKLDEAQEAASTGDNNKIREKLRELRQKIQEKTREGKMDDAFAQQVISIIDAVATTYGVVLSSEGGNEQRGKDDNKKR